MTPQEKKVWGYLNKRAVLGLRFKVQHSIQNYIVDFYCHYLKLVIEVGGGGMSFRRIRRKIWVENRI